MKDIFYLDNEYNLYDKEGNVICNLRDNASEYGVDLVSNMVYKNGELVGMIDDPNALGMSHKNSDTKVRRLVPGNNQNGNFGMGKISIIGLLLVVGIVFIIYMVLR